jgi:DNA-binding CsgD family transcriptional regulator
MPLDKVAYGKLVAAFLRAGWNPPAPDDRVLNHILDDINSLPGTSTLVLSKTERESLELVSEGLSESEQASRLGLSKHTIQTRLRRVRQKLGARNTTHAVALGITLGVIDGSDRPALEAELSAKERVSLTFCAHGYQRGEQAQILSCAMETIASRLTSARRKLGAHTSTEAVAIAIKSGLIGPVHGEQDQQQER